MSEDQLVATLNRLVDEAHRSEIIGGVSIADALECVDLDVEHTPVLQVRGQSLPEAVPVVGRTRRGEYILQGVFGTEIVSADVLKVMRCRYLLTLKAEQRLGYGSLLKKLEPTDER